MEEIPKNEIPKESEISKESVPTEKEKDLTVILSYIGILFLIPLLVCKNNTFAQFHAKQGLVLFIAEVATSLIAVFPIIGWLIGFIGWMIWLVLSVMGIINVLNDKQSPLPIIGKFADKFKF